MQLIQLLLPLYDNDGQRFPPEFYAEVRHDLIETFGGLTVYAHAPVEGLWQPDEEATPVHDELVIFEVISEKRKASWWKEYRQRLQQRFRQEDIVIRSSRIELL